MSVISSISGLFQGFSPLGFIRTRFVRLGALIRWIGQRLTARNRETVVSQARQEWFGHVERLAARHTGPMDQDECEQVAGFLNDMTGPDGVKAEAHAQFVLDAVRTRDIRFEGIQFSAGAPKFQRAYETYLQNSNQQHSSTVRAQFFAEYLIQKAGKSCDQSPRWLGILEGIIHQASNIYITRLAKLMEDGQGLAFGMGTGAPTFPRSVDIRLERDEGGEIIGAHLNFQLGYRASRDLPVGAVSHLKVNSAIYIDFDDQDRVRVSKGAIAMQAVGINEVSLREIVRARTYSRSEYLGDGIAQWTFWGANALSLGYLEQRSVSPHLDQMEEYVRHSGEGEVGTIREHIAELDRLYRERGQERYRQVKLAMVRSLFEQESARLDYRDVETGLSAAIVRQFADRTVDGDLRMFVGDNGTRSIMKSDVVFERSEERPYARYNSESAYYAGDEMGDERRYFKALQEELHRRYPGESPVRDMVQALMTQDITFGFTADLFAKTAADGYVLPGDIPGAAESSIVVRSDERITYVFKTRYDLLGMDQQSAGQIAVDVALDLRYENETWVPRIVKRDIKVVHSP